MNCPLCGSKLRTPDTRSEGLTTYREHVCSNTKCTFIGHSMAKVIPYDTYISKKLNQLNAIQRKRRKENVPN